MQSDPLQDLVADARNNFPIPIIERERTNRRLDELHRQLEALIRTMVI
jgi:hypothetical protein